MFQRDSAHSKITKGRTIHTKINAIHFCTELMNLRM